MDSVGSVDKRSEDSRPKGQLDDKTHLCGHCQETRILPGKVSMPFPLRRAWRVSWAPTNWIVQNDCLDVVGTLLYRSSQRHGRVYGLDCFETRDFFFFVLVCMARTTYKVSHVITHVTSSGSPAREFRRKRKDNNPFQLYAVHPFVPCLSEQPLFMWARG